MTTDYIPRRGDVVWLTLDPQAIYEQAGRKPSIMKSPLAYKTKVGLALFCPVTSDRTRPPSGIEIPIEQTIGGMKLSTQLNHLNWRVRKAGHLFRLPTKTTLKTLSKIPTLTV